jgi:rod shape-determining protein MreD
MALSIRLDRAARNTAPFAFSFILVLIGAVPWPLLGISLVAPMLALITVFYWTIHRPAVMPPAAAFALGLVQDILGGAPIGLNALVLVAVHGLVASQRRYFVQKSFLIVWAGFLVVAAGAGFLAWAVASIYFGVLVGPDPLIVQYLLNLCAYPALAWLLERVHRSLPAESSA